MRRKGRLLSLLLVVCLAAGMMPATVFAVPGTSGNPRTAASRAARERRSVLLVDPTAPGGGILGYRAGEYDHVYFGARGSSADTPPAPLAWRVLDVETSGGKTVLFLLADEQLGGNIQFNKSETDSNTWSGSNAQAWCKDFAGETSSGLAASPFTDKERAAFLAVSDDVLSAANVFFLSEADVKNAAYGFGSPSLRIFKNISWWLRTPLPTDNNKVLVVERDGLTNHVLVNSPYYGVRPAFKLDMSQVLFVESGGSSSAGTNATVPLEADKGAGWRIVLRDTSRTFKAYLDGGSGSGPVELDQDKGGNIDITYQDAMRGDDEYVSFLLADADGNVLYHGQICDVKTDDKKNGTGTVAVPKDLPEGSYTLKIFNEEKKAGQGSALTGSASDFSDIAIKVKDSKKPVLTELKAERLSGTEARITFTSSEAGEYYYKVVKKGDPAPVIDTTGKGTDIPADVLTQTFEVDGLTSGTEYIVYIAAKDKASTPNVSDTYPVSVSADVAQVYSLDVDPASLDFGVQEEDYGELSEEITITNTGNQPATVKPPAIAGDYVLAETFPETTLALKQSVTFKVQPKSGLAVGEYPGSVAVSYTGAGGNQEEKVIPLSFKVTEKARYSISVDPADLDFGSAEEGYGRPEAKTVTVKNTGNQDIHLSKSTETADYDDRPFTISSFSGSKLLITPGETASFTVQPKAGLSKGTYKETITITGNRRADDAQAVVTAEFTVTSPGAAAETCTITAETEGEGGTITPSSAEVLKGGNASFTVTPEEGYEVEKVLVDGAEDVTGQLSDRGEYTFRNVTRDHTIQASFKAVSSEPAETCTVTVGASPAAGGKAEVSGGGTSGTYEAGSQVMVTATANEGYHFVRWTENGSEVSSSASYTFEITADRNLTAVFEADTPAQTSHTVTVNSSYAQTSGAGTYAAGATVTIQAGTRQNYRFDSWATEDGVTFADADSATTTFTMPDKDVTVTAKWTYTGSTGTNNGTNFGNNGTTSGNNNGDSGGNGTVSDGKGGTYTGDDAPTAMWISTLCTSFGLMAVLGVLGWRRRKLYPEFMGQWRGLTEKEFGQKRRS